MIISLGFVAPANAQGHDRPIRFSLDRTEAWDANVFRKPSSDSDPQLATRGLSGRSDRISTTHVGFLLDKSYAQQHISLAANRTATRYDKFVFLDRNALNYSGTWDWRITSRISGKLFADRSESLIGFDDTQILTRNVRVTTNRGISLDGWLFGGWHLRGGVSRTVINSTSIFAAQPDFSQDTVDYGVTYIATSQNSLSVVERRRRGVYTGQTVNVALFVDSGYSVLEREVAGVWKLSGKSSLNGQFTHVARRNNNISQRDFSGLQGNLSYNWAPIGGITLVALASRSLFPFASGTTSTYRDESLVSLSPVWAPTNRTSVRLNATRKIADYLGSVGPVAGPARRDGVRSLELAASWSPYTNVTLNTSIRRELRASTDATFNYGDTIANVSANLRF